MEAVIVAVFHNVCCKRNEENPPIDDEVEAIIQLINNVNNVLNIRNKNNILINNLIRLALINNYFATL